jgi:acetyl-CoA acetyltransferase
VHLAIWRLAIGYRPSARSGRPERHRGARFGYRVIDRVEIQAVEDLGFVAEGDGGPAIADGLFDRDGALPVNTSGGLLGRGAPVGATGIAQAIEIIQQLWGAMSPDRQIANARLGMTDTHAGIGTICVVNIFERRD